MDISAGDHFVNPPSSRRERALREISMRCGAQRPFEHCYERASAVVPNVLSDCRDGLACGQESQRVQQPHLLSPPAKRHARLSLKKPLQGPGTGRCSLRHLLDQTWIVRMRTQP